jgi:hypothetical protein
VSWYTLMRSELRRAGLVMWSAALLGCGAAAPVIKLVQVEGKIIRRAEPCLVSEYRQDQQDCLDGPPEKAEACVADVRVRWKDIIDALADEHAARCELEPAKCTPVRP